MRIILATCFALALCVGLCDAVRIPKYTISDQFDTAMEKVSLSLVMFQRGSCEQCKNIESAFQQAAGQLLKLSNPVQLATVNIDESNELGIKYGIHTTPTLKMFRYGREVIRPYLGGTNPEDIIEYMTTVSQSPSKEVNSVKEALEIVPPAGFPLDDRTPAHLAKIVIFGFFKMEDQDMRELMAAEDELRDTKWYTFVHTTSEEVMNEYRTRHSFVIFNPSAPQHSRVVRWDMHKPITFDGALDFIAQHGRPLVGMYGQETHVIYRRDVVPVFRLFLNRDERNNARGIEHYRKRLSYVAQKYPTIAFSLAGLEYLEDAKAVGFVAANIHDGVCMMINSKGFRYRPEKLEVGFGVQPVVAFVESFLKSEIEPYVKSLPVPTEQQEVGGGKVLTVVGKTFTHLVTRSDVKVIFLAMISESCGHCTKLLPLLDTLAEKFKGNKDVAVALFDAKQNEVPVNSYSVTAFPTIFVVPSDKKGKPIVYSQAREVEKFVDAIHAELNRIDSEEKEL